ncbi:MAG: DNA cytosine methyltransferase [Streptosporangiaceae bacterium]
MTRQPGQTVMELCAGGGGSSLGLEAAGFRHGALVEIDADCCATLRLNRPGWLIRQGSIAEVDGRLAYGVDLISAGLPCTPHSRGGRQLGADDERHLWADALRIIGEAMPRAVLIETADAILTPKFGAEREVTLEHLGALGYTGGAGRGQREPVRRPAAPPPGGLGRLPRAGRSGCLPLASAVTRSGAHGRRHAL